MVEFLDDIWLYLVGIQFHPFVTAAVFLIISMAKLRWESPYIDRAKLLIEKASCASSDEAKAIMIDKVEAQKSGGRVEDKILIVACIVSLLGQLAFYWPNTRPQSYVICLFMAGVQVAAAWIINFYCIKWKLMDVLGDKLKKKID